MTPGELESIRYSAAVFDENGAPRERVKLTTAENLSPDKPDEFPQFVPEEPRFNKPLAQDGSPLRKLESSAYSESDKVTSFRDAGFWSIVLKHLKGAGRTS